MSKQNTILIFDVSSSMLEAFVSKKTGNALKNSIDYGLNIIASNIISNKKSEQVGIVTFHDTKTRNSMYEETKLMEEESLNWVNCVFHTPRKFDWDSSIKMKQEWVIARKEDIDYKDEADVPRALAITFDEIRKSNPYSGIDKTPKRKETYNIILFSDFKNKCSWGTLDDIIIELAKTYDCPIGIIYADHGQTQEEVFKQNLIESTAFIDKLKKITGKISYSYITDLASAQRELKDWSCQPTKMIKPMVTFKGEIRLGCDLDNIDLINCLAELNYHGGNEESLRPDYNTKKDYEAIIFSAEGYPLTRSQSITVTKEIGIKKITNEDKKKGAIKHRLFDLSRASEKFYTLDEANIDVKNPDEYNKMQFIIDESNIEERFKYGSTPLLINTALDEQLNIAAYQGIDIIELVNKYSIPPWYYSGETTIILPEENSTLRDKLAMDSLCQAMLKSNLVAVCRVVMKTQKEVLTCALIPCIVLTEATKAKSTISEPVIKNLKRSARELEGEDENTDHYGFTLVRLPFKDDEKLSNTKNLKLLANEDSKGSVIEEFPTVNMLDSMDQLIESMDLDKLDGAENEMILEDKFVELNQFPPIYTSATKRGLSETGLRQTFNSVTRKLLSLNSPKVHVLSTVIRIFVAMVLYTTEEPEETLFDMIGLPDEGFSTEEQKELRKTLKLLFDETSNYNYIPKIYDKEKLKDNPKFQKIAQDLIKQLDIKKVDLPVLENRRSKNSFSRDAEEAISLDDLIGMT